MRYYFLGIATAAAFFWAAPRTPAPQTKIIERCVVTQADLHLAEEKCSIANERMRTLEDKNHLLLAKVEEVIKEFWEFRGKVLVSEPNNSCGEVTRIPRHSHPFTNYMPLAKVRGPV